MEKEFNLSEKIHKGNMEIDLPAYIDKEDVKEFIRKLKEPFTIPKSWDTNTTKNLCEFFRNRIDKLAGDKLI